MEEDKKEDQSQEFETQERPQQGKKTQQEKTQQKIYKEENKQKIKVGDTFKEAWVLTNSNLGFLAGLLIVFVISSLILSGVNVIPAVGQFLFIAVSYWLGIGLFNIFLDIYNKEKTEVIELFNKKNWRMVFDVFFVDFLVYLISFLGFLLFIVPGIYFGLIFSQSKYLVIDKKMDCLSAMKKSVKITEGYKWQILLLKLINSTLFVLGILSLFLGCLWIFPITYLADIIIYKKLLKIAKLD